MRKLYVFVGMILLSMSFSYGQESQYVISGTEVNPHKDDKTDRNILDSLNSHYGIGEVIQIIRVKEEAPKETPPKEVVKEEPPKEEIKETPPKEIVKEEPPKEAPKEIAPKEAPIVKAETEHSSASQKSSSTGKKSSSAKSSSSRKRVKRKKSWNRGRIKKTKRKRKMGRRAVCPKF